jgi:leader peptidase (prepilin peptidase)/N-methyltransferase
LWAGLLFNIWETYVPLVDAVIGAMVGYLALWLVYWLFRFFTGKEGMGFGDFKLLAAIGAWVGWPLMPAVILESSIAGVLIGGAMLLAGRAQRGQALPFGPYLACAGVSALLWGGHWSILY